jgi:hypothetical protein
MSILANLAANWRWGLYGLIAVGLLAVGWTVNSWRIDAARLKDAQAALRSEMAARVKADADRLDLGMKLSEAEADILTATKIITKKVKIYVPDNRACDLGLPAIRLLNRARAGLPPAPDDPAPAAPEP